MNEIERLTRERDALRKSAWDAATLSQQLAWGTFHHEPWAHLTHRIEQLQRAAGLRHKTSIQAHKVAKRYR